MTTAGSRLDPWVDAYAARANAMRASEIRALFAVASRPEVVSLAGGDGEKADALEDVFWALLNSKEFYFNH